MPLTAEIPEQLVGQTPHTDFPRRGDGGHSISSADSILISGARTTGSWGRYGMAVVSRLGEQNTTTRGGGMSVGLCQIELEETSSFNLIPEDRTLDWK